MALTCIKNAGKQDSKENIEKMEGKTPRGKPRIQWENQVKKEVINSWIGRKQKMKNCEKNFLERPNIVRRQTIHKLSGNVFDDDYDVFFPVRSY